MGTVNYVPRAEKDFLDWVVALLRNLANYLTKFNFPEAVFLRLEAEKNDFAQKLEIATQSGTRTSVTVRDKNTARKLLEKDMRLAVNEFLRYNSALTDGDRERLGLTIYKTTRTPTPVAETYPEFYLDSHTHRRLIIHFYDWRTVNLKAKPPGQHAAEIRWAICDVPPKNVGDLTNTSFTTRTPFTLEFDEYQRGKTLYFALRWENTRGLPGPWSDIKAAVIP
jgi:hypothetical protein